jgi:methylthioxylose transferase
MVLGAHALPALRGRVRFAPSGWTGAVVWASVVLAGHLLGARLVAHDPLVHISSPPLVGVPDIRIGWSLLPAVAIAVAAVCWAPAIAQRLRWGALLVATWAAGIVWAVALAASAGFAAIAAPLSTRYEYLGAVSRVGSLHSFLVGFVHALPTYPTHVKGHPPGMLLLLSLLDATGLGGADIAAAVVIGVGALAAPAALVALRTASNESWARRAAPFVAFTPAAVWIATSADALFAGVAAAGLALAVLTLYSAERRRALVLGLAAGLVLGGALMLSYGIAPLSLIVLVLAIARRAWWPLAAIAAGVAIVMGAFAVAGFWWPDGLAATSDLYHGGNAARRPYAPFLVISLAAFALALGPAAIAGFTRLKDRRVWLLAGAALASLAAADISGLSRGETERIWLIFVPWIGLGAAALVRRRSWLALQLGLAIVVQAAVRTPW